MEPTTWILIGSLLFGGWQFQRAEGLETQIDGLRAANVLLVETANNNAAEVAKLKKLVNKNGMVTRGVSADLGVCVKKLRSYEATVAIFDRRRQSDAVVIETMEKRLADSDLGSCRVPGWLVDEVARDSD